MQMWDKENTHSASISKAPGSLEYANQVVGMATYAAKRHSILGGPCSAGCVKLLSFEHVAD